MVIFSFAHEALRRKRPATFSSCGLTCHLLQRRKGLAHELAGVANGM